MTRLWPLVLGLTVACTCREKAVVDAGRLRKVDVHTHFSPAAAPRMLKLMDTWGIDTVVNLSSGWPGEGLEETMAVARAHPGRIIVFANPPLHRAKQGGDWAASLPGELEAAHKLGARGVKIFKSLGLSIHGPDGKLLAVDDPALDALFEKAGELHMPVSIHTGDPIAFWQPVTEENERYDELSVHPGWSYAGRPVPTWEELFSGYERLVAKHPNTTFIGVHFGNDPEDPQRVAGMLSKYPNLYVDTAARVPELGRRNSDQLRALFIKHQDRILFGTDLGVGEREEALMLGSTGATPPGPADVERFFTSTWRFFETRDKRFASPTPIQGRWKIDGLALPPDVLRKVYSENADRLLGATR